MIHRILYSVFFIIIFSTINFPQTLKSFDVNGNIEFSKSDYLRWTGLRINQQLFTAYEDSVKSRIAFNLSLFGYHFSRINSFDKELNSDSTISITISVDEGKPTIINKIVVEGADSVEDAEIINSFDFLSGQILIKNEIETEIESTLEFFENKGYPFITIKINSIQLYQDSLEDENFADIYFQLIKGNESRIDNIEIRGNQSTKDYVIIRELRLEKGAIYSQKQIDEFPGRLNRLRFFEPLQKAQFYLNSKNEGILLINVNEKNTNNFDGVIGYIPPNKNESSGYITGLINISLRNLFGTGRAASIRWNKFDRNSQELDLKYLEPWLLGFPFNINLNLYQRIQDTTYVQRKLEAGLEYLATEDISASLFASTESVIPTIRTIPVFTVYNSSYFTTGIALKIDTRDDPYAPTEGLLFINSYSFSRKKISGPAEYITPELDTEIDLQRFALSFSFFYQIFSRQIIAIGINGKELRGSEFENSDLYRLGGTNSLRGYREEQFLGSRIFWTNLEYRLLLSRRSYGFLFFDTGYYLRPADEEKNILKQEDFKYGYGLGLSLETALGVLGVTFALGEGDSFSDGKIHFGIINEF